MNEEEVARAVEEGMRRHHNQRVAAWQRERDRESARFLGCLVFGALMVLGFILLVTYG